MLRTETRLDPLVDAHTHTQSGIDSVKGNWYCDGFVENSCWVVEISKCHGLRRDRKLPFHPYPTRFKPSIGSGEGVDIQPLLVRAWALREKYLYEGLTGERDKIRKECRKNTWVATESDSEWQHEFWRWNLFGLRGGIELGDASRKSCSHFTSFPQRLQDSKRSSSGNRHCYFPLVQVHRKAYMIIIKVWSHSTVFLSSPLLAPGFANRLDRWRKAQR